MTIQEILVSIMSFGALMVSAWSVLIARKKQPHETDSIDADTVEKFERVATSAAARAERTDARITEMQKSYDELLSAYQLATAEIRSLRSEINEVKQENGDLRHWADLLVKQVVQLGGSPAPMPKSYTRPRPKQEGE